MFVSSKFTWICPLFHNDNDNDNHTKVDQQDEQEKQNAADEALDQEVSLFLHFL